MSAGESGAGTPGQLSTDQVARVLDGRRRRSGDLVHDVALFASILGECGASVPTSSSILAVRALAEIDVSDRLLFLTALRATLGSTRGEVALLDLVAPLFWDGAPPGAESEIEAGHERETDGDSQVPPSSGSDVQPPDGRQPDHAGSIRSRRSTYSPRGTSPREPGGSPADYDRVLAAAQQFSRALRGRRSRRLRSASYGDSIHIRDSMRMNLRYGGELVELRREQPRSDRGRAVILCDVSTSMAPHLPMFLAFAHAMTRASRGAETAIFNIGTVFVTDVFRRATLPDALAWLGRRSVALAGGTRIGESLRGFTDELEVRGALGPRTYALVLSDGWDVGDQALLDAQMRRLSSRVDRVFWLDPHAAAVDFAPQVQGLRTALRWVSAYRDFSSIDALEALAAQVNGHHRGLPELRSAHPLPPPRTRSTA